MRPAAFRVMVKPRGPVCNLDCQYCYYLSKEDLYPGSDFQMDDATLKTFIQQHTNAQRVPQVYFDWQGGEPTLLGIDFFRRIVAFQKRYVHPGLAIINTLQTNGTLLTEEWASFLNKHDFLVGLSLDGPRSLHDAYRIDKGGEPTFDRVMRGLSLLKKHHVDFNILCTIHTANVEHTLDVYRFLRDEAGAQFLQFIPIVERIANTEAHQDGPVTDRSVTGVQYGQFLIQVFDEWVRSDVGNVFVQIFDSALAAWVGQQPGMCIFEETCGSALALEHNGDLYACDHYVQPDHLLGNVRNTNIIELVASEKQHDFGQAKRDSLPRYCRSCKVRFVCNGGCPKNRFIDTPDGEPGLNYLCLGYKAFFHHIAPAMQYMADQLRQKRSPANVMNWIAQPDRQPQE